MDRPGSRINRGSGWARSRQASRTAATVSRTHSAMAGGSSISDYAGADGALGYFQHSFRVYGREGEPCPDGCGGVVERIVQGGRSTFYCPRCQT